MKIEKSHPCPLSVKQFPPPQIERGPYFGRLLTYDAPEQTADHAVPPCMRVCCRAIFAIAPGSWVEADPHQEVTHGREQTPERD